MKVTIPAKDEHEGIYSMIVEISDNCPKCGGKRGEPYETISFDGSRRLVCHGWVNPCGHIDLYRDVRKEFRDKLKCKRCQGTLTKGSFKGVITLGCDCCGQLYNMKGEMI